MPWGDEGILQVLGGDRRGRIDEHNLTISFPLHLARRRGRCQDFATSLIPTSKYLSAVEAAILEICSSAECQSDKRPSISRARPNRP